MSEHDFDKAARLINASARRDWLRSAVPLPRERFDDDPPAPPRAKAAASSPPRRTP